MIYYHYVIRTIYSLYMQVIGNLALYITILNNTTYTNHIMHYALHNNA